jgi:hypothetical protein
MKQPLTFKTDQPLKKGYIYLIRQGDVKKVCSVGSVERMNLTGEWKIIKEFANEIS